MNTEKQSQRIGDILSDQIISIDPTTSVADAWLVAQKNGIGHLPVLEGGRLVGLIGAADLGGSPTTTPVAELMNKEVVTISPEDAALDAAALMRERKVGSLPVIVADEIVGIVTHGDLLRAGLPEETVIGEMRCVACGSYRHVRLEPRFASPFCTECLERAGPPSYSDDLGDGD